MKQSFYIFLIVLFGSHISVAQDFFRMKAEISVKIADSNGTKSLTRGIVYYDKHIKQLIYDISFPAHEKWVYKDTSLCKYADNSLKECITTPALLEFTVFHFALNSSLNEFGLKNSVYAIERVEKKGDLVLSYWKIPRQAETLTDYVVVAKKGNRLESVFMFAKDKTPLSKHFFRNYFMFGAFEFPQQIVEILYDKKGRECYQVTEFKNIVTNDINDKTSYQYNR